MGRGRFLMPIDKAIDSAQLDANLTAVADAIRTKGETTEQLVFPGGFVAAIETMETGKTGATLTVTTPAEGITVTVAKGELSYTQTAGADYTATFTGLESGTWTIKISNGEQTATGTVDIDADYASNMTFFAATINVTYPAGSVCTATDGVITLTAPDTSGTWACVVPNAGTWTVMCYDGSDYDSSENKTSDVVEITTDGQSVDIALDYVLILFDGENGGDNTSVTGGWTKSNRNGSTSISDTQIYVNETPNSAGAGYAVVTTDQIDVTKYSTLYATCKLITYRWGPPVVGLFSNTTKGDGQGYVSVINWGSTNDNDYVTKSLDISSVKEGSYYIGSKGLDPEFSIKKLWLK